MKYHNIYEEMITIHADLVRASLIHERMLNDLAITTFQQNMKVKNTSFPIRIIWISTSKILICLWTGKHDDWRSRPPDQGNNEALKANSRWEIYNRLAQQKFVQNAKDRRRPP